MPKKRIKNDYIKKLFRRFLNYEENLHNGETVKENYLNGFKSTKYAQYKTTITNDNQEQKCYIYDQLMLIDNQPFLLLKIHNDKKRETWTSIIYFEKNEMVQQIRHLSYEQFFTEVKDNENKIKTEESENTTIIKTPFLVFRENINKYKTDEQQSILKQENVKKSKNKKYVWWIIKFIAFTGCIVISTALGLIPSAIILGIAAIKPLAIGVSIGLGFIAIPWNNIRNKIVDWVFKKNIYEKVIEKKDKKIEDLKQECKESNELIKELFLNSNPKAKQKSILSVFLQIWEKNKNKDFFTLQNELNKKFDENKYAKQIEKWNKDWNEKVEFTKFLKPENIKEIKGIFNNSIMPDGFLYHPKKLWDQFQEGKTKKSTLQNEQDFNNFNNTKSIIETMEKRLLYITMSEPKKKKPKKKKPLNKTMKKPEKQRRKEITL